MAKILIEGEIYSPALIVFDKDGLLFDSKSFWAELARLRAAELKRHLSARQLCSWLKLCGVHYSVQGDGFPAITGVQSDGVTAVASEDEEAMITGTFLMQELGLSWPAAREISRGVYRESDKKLDLNRCAVPKKGFPDIFRRLYDAGIPYGVATSDDMQRAIGSISMFDDVEHISFIITPKEVGRNKPAPDMLELISERTGVLTSDMMMVGDSYVDVSMARSVNAVGVGIPETPAMREKMRPYASVIIDSLDQIEIVG